MTLAHGWWLLALHVALQAALIARALLRPHRDPAARMAWVLVILAAPVVGMLAYLLLGETSIGRAHVRRMRAAEARLPPPGGVAGPAAGVADRDAPLTSVARSVSGFEPVAGNAVALMESSDAAIAALVADIDAARDHVHLLFYIWLDDGNGMRVAEAAMRAAGRGVTVRAMADGLGSRALIRGPVWARMAAAGVRLGVALPVGNPLLRLLRGRIDLRNHRKIAVIDGGVTYVGSQNCADPAFLPKARFAPWVDLMLRVEGPVARQAQWLFAADWMTQVDDDELAGLLDAPLPEPADPGAVAQVIGSGPTVRASAMPEMIEALMYAARRELVVTTPYYVPDEAMQAALCASARRGVETTLVLPARNDSPIVAAASRSYYGDLLEAGVRLFEYPLGLLHTKSLTLDGRVALVGSANLDRRSFDLNFENVMLLLDPAATAAVRGRQADYLAASRAVTVEEVAGWSAGRRLWNNAVAMLGPVL